MSTPVQPWGRKGGGGKLILVMWGNPKVCVLHPDFNGSLGPLEEWWLNGDWSWVCVLSHCSPVWPCVTLWTVARQAPLSTGFSRQEHWSGLPCSASGVLPNPAMETGPSHLLHWWAGSLPLAPPGEPLKQTVLQATRLSFDKPRKAVTSRELLEPVKQRSSQKSLWINEVFLNGPVVGNDCTCSKKLDASKSWAEGQSI